MMCDPKGVMTQNRLRTTVLMIPPCLFTKIIKKYLFYSALCFRTA